MDDDDDDDGFRWSVCPFVFGVRFSAATTGDSRRSVDGRVTVLMVRDGVRGGVRERGAQCCQYYTDRGAHAYETHAIG